MMAKKQKSLADLLTAKGARSGVVDLNGKGYASRWGVLNKEKRVAVACGSRVQARRVAQGLRRGDPMNEIASREGLPAQAVQQLEAVDA
jgi:hypothetical protein